MQIIEDKEVKWLEHVQILVTKSDGLHLALLNFEHRKNLFHNTRKSALRNKI